MTATLAHRGPDDTGTFLDGGLALGHRRLAVIDCSPTGHQPMASADGRYVVVTNSEVYNFVPLRAELARLGYPFRGTSDTEVLVAGLSIWGIEETLVRVNGMFALAVWDSLDRRLVLARDRFGEKPLYYAWCGDVFLFGSELKALGAHPAFVGDVDRDALALYFRYNCIPAPHSIFRGVSKLPPGSLLSVDSSSSPSEPLGPVPFWRLADLAEQGRRHRSSGSLEGSVAELDDVLGDAVRLRMHADVPLGAFLSGGIDSSLVVALMAAHSSSKVRTFTIGFEDTQFDEAADAAAVAAELGTDHTELLVTATEAMNVIPRLPHLYDEPFADSSQIPQAVLAQLTRQHVTVALSGDGGDELFGGYNRYAFATRFWPRIRRVPRPLRKAGAALLEAAPASRWDDLAVRVGSALPASWRVRMPGTKLHKAARVLPAPDLLGVYRLLASHFDDPGRVVLGATEPPALPTTPESWPDLEDPVEQMLYLDTMTYLPDDILTKVDRATMAVNLETRLPFLDPAVATLAWRMPLEHKLHRGTGKWVVRQLLHRYVPAQLVERPKAGFGVPLGEWLRGPLRPWAEDMLSAERLEHQGYLAADVVRRLWSEHQSRRHDWPYELWDVLVFQAWLDAWVARS